MALNFRPLRTRFGIALWCVFAALSVARPAAAQNVTGQWTFNNTYNAVIGNNLTAPIGWTFENATINGETARVASFPQGLGANDYLIVRHGIAPNGGGGYVNQYTIVMDVLFPAINDWIALMNTNEVNGNDADWYISPENGVGIEGDYTDDGNSTRFVGGQWNRLALVVDLANGYYASYINGVLQNVKQDGNDLDGRFSLYSVNDSTPWFLLFAEGDTSGVYTSSGKINNLQVRDYAMSPYELAAMGGATAGPIPTTLPVRIAGTLTLEGLVSEATPRNIAFDFRNASGATLFRITQPIGANGAFNLTGIPGLSYTLNLSGKPYLSKNAALDATTGSVIEFVESLRVGDITSDAIVDLFDLVALFDSYGEEPGGEAWNNGQADLNGDNIVDLLDLVALFNNYGEEGDL